MAQEASQAKVRNFGYISAAAGAPILPSRYITTKREAEDIITKTFPSLRSFFVRPGFLYDSSRTFTMPMAGLSLISSMANSLVGGILSGPLGAAVAKPLKADLVAEAVIEALADDDIRGPIEISEIEGLATKQWRRNML